MFTPKIDRPYFDAWLKRAGKQFAASGRMSQVAVTLAKREGGTADEWRARLRTILEGGEIPSLDLLIRIDEILTTRSEKKTPSDNQTSFF